MKIDYSKQKFTQDEIAFIAKEVTHIRTKYPNHIPIIVKINPKDNTLRLQKYKFLVDKNISVGQFLYTVRKRLDSKLSATEGLYLFCDNMLPPTSEMLSFVYNNHKDPQTGMLVFILCKENTFGKKIETPEKNLNTKNTSNITNSARIRNVWIFTN